MIEQHVVYAVILVLALLAIYLIYIGKAPAPEVVPAPIAEPVNVQECNTSPRRL